MITNPEHPPTKDETNLSPSTHMSVYMSVWLVCNPCFDTPASTPGSPGHTQGCGGNDDRRQLVTAMAHHLLHRPQTLLGMQRSCSANRYLLPLPLLPSGSPLLLLPLLLGGRDMRAANLPFQVSGRAMVMCLSGSSGQKREVVRLT